MRSDCTIWTKTCVNSQTSKVNRHTKTPIGESDVPKGARTYSYRYCRTVTFFRRLFLHSNCERTSCTPETHPILDCTAETVAKTLSILYLSFWRSDN